MTRPTRAQREIESLENYIATVNFLLDLLRIGLANAHTEALAARIDGEIERRITQLAELHAERDSLRRRPSRRRRAGKRKAQR